MKTNRSILYLSLICSIMLFGCPYESKISLSNPAESFIDTTLNGSWVGLIVNDEMPITGLDINPFNEKEYLVEMFGKGNGGLTIQNYRAFATTLSHQKILNVQELGDKRNFSFYKYAVSNDTLRVAAVSKEAVKKYLEGREEFKNREEMIDCLTKRMNDPEFFDQERVYIKRGK